MSLPSQIVVALLTLFVALGPARAQMEAGDAPTVTLQAVDGEPLELSSLEGRVVLVDFWATWCPPCLSALTFYAELEARYGDQGFSVLAVSVDEQRDDMNAFLARHQLPLTMFWDQEHAVVGMFQPPTMPTSYLIDRQGTIRYVHEGFEPDDREAIEAHLTTLLQEDWSSDPG